MDNQQIGIILLIKSALTGEKFTLPNDFDFESAAKTARKHQITALFYYGALNCGISQELPSMQHLFLDTCKFISISERQTYEINEMFRRFDENKIDYMPLKGTLLKRLYPKSEMRVMSDADILIRTEQYEEIKPVMQQLGFLEILESDHELVWDKKGVHIELHKRLIPSYNKDYYKYFGDGWRLGAPISEGSTRYAMKAEDEMIYLFTHYAKHYRDAGIGIKHIVDLWVYRNSAEKLNDEYIFSELIKLQLDDFYKNTIRTLDVWFGSAETDEITEFITQVIFNSGVYGTHNAHILSAAVKSTKTTGTAEKARSKKIKELIFLPYGQMCQKYTVVKKVPVLLPFMWVVRWFDVLIFKRKNIKRHNESLKLMSAERIDDYQQALNFVGLDFNFEE